MGSSADGVEIRRRSLFAGVARGIANLRRLPGDDYLRDLFPSTVLWLPKQVIPESVGCFKSPSGTGSICPK
jgi:hypothetical protein